MDCGSEGYMKGLSVTHNPQSWVGQDWGTNDRYDFALVCADRHMSDAEAGQSGAPYTVYSTQPTTYTGSALTTTASCAGDGNVVVDLSVTRIDTGPFGGNQDCYDFTLHCADGTSQTLKGNVPGVCSLAMTTETQRANVPAGMAIRSIKPRSESFFYDFYSFDVTGVDVDCAL